MMDPLSETTYPSPNSSSDARFEHVCLDFERAWRDGQSPVIERYLESSDPSQRGSLLRQLVLKEIELRESQGEIVSRKHYVKRFQDADPETKRWLVDLVSAGSNLANKELTVEQTRFVETDPSEALTHADPPKRIGRFDVIRELGKGGFANVYLAYDSLLDRYRALKVPRLERFRSADALRFFLREARTAAQLEHPGIVRIYDVQQDDDGIYIVQEFIDGGPLDEYLRDREVPDIEIVQLMIQIAEAIGYAHEKCYWHRDLKPQNILIDAAGNAHVADFGLAIHESMQRERIGEVVGTTPYMSPEQIRGETHRLDGRTDIWSLGIIFYLMLTGCRPFTGESKNLLKTDILQREPKPPRMLRRKISRELSRICMVCLAKKASDRYLSAADLIEDLQYWLSAQLNHDDHQSGISEHSSTQEAIRVVPRGLRSFEASDAGFYQSLLPGPHDREGVPKCIHFWKEQIEERDPERTFSVGLMYGPSGCGKSSLVKAGIIPELSEDIITVYLEATSEGTEVRLARSLIKQCPDLADIDSLPNMVALLRQRGGVRGCKIVVILDQFEQWLHDHESPDDELVRTLRHCDGASIQCIVLVRDDFYVSISRFFQSLEVKLVEGHNCVLVDLFDVDHARKVLTAIGQAYGRLPLDPSEISESQRRFVEQAIRGLAVAGKVNCVRLAAFGEMVKAEHWTEETLAEIGGAQGAGVKFLDATFNDKTAPPEHRLHQNAVRAVLQALLPDGAADIKGEMKSRTELRAIAGYEHRPADFDTVIRILDNETRLITPTDAYETANKTHSAGEESKFYQLAHDFLVPSIRDWLTRHQRETWRGRSQLNLDERTVLWMVRRETKQLPSLWETALIRLGTNRDRWSQPQREMMDRAFALHGRRIMIGIAATMVFVIAGGMIYRRANHLRQTRISRAMVDRLLVAEPERVVPVLQEMRAMQTDWRERLLGVDDDPRTSTNERLRAELALVSQDRTRVDQIADLIEHTDVETLKIARSWILSVSTPDPAGLWKLANSKSLSPSYKLRVAGLLAGFDPDNETQWAQISHEIANLLVDDPGLETEKWDALLAPAGKYLASPLAVLFREDGNVSRRLNAAEHLAFLGSTNLVCDLIPDANPTQLSILIRALHRDKEAAIQNLNASLAKSLKAFDSGNPLPHVGKTRTIAASLILLGRGDLVWPLLGSTSNGSLRTELIMTMRSFGVPIRILFEAESTVTDPVARQAIWMSMTSEDASLSALEIEAISQRVKERFTQVAHQSERAALSWLSKKIGREELLQQETELPPSDRDWFTNAYGQQFGIHKGPVEFMMGSPDGETYRRGEETYHRRVIMRDFAIGIHEVTADEFRQFRPNYSADSEVCRTGDSPVISISWYEAARYCRWLSEQENVDEDQMCYPPIDQIHEGMTFDDNMLDRTGYRLPTEAEWEYCCRGGEEEKFFFGADEKYLSDFGWWGGNSRARVWPVGLLRPNRFGIFDCAGNVGEWCQDAFEFYPVGDRRSIVSRSPAATRSLSGQSRVMRGARYRSSVRAMRSADRGYYPPSTEYSTTGFRIARTMPANDP